MAAAPRLIHPVILCGGAGSRLWPMSRRLLPKQFLPLVGEHTLLQATALRAASLASAAAPIVVCSEEHRFIAGEQLAAVGIVPAAMLLEPAPRSTAPAIAAAALAASEADRRAMLLVLPADHDIRDLAAFADAVSSASEAAAAGRLVTFGVPPTAPETAYGYLERGAALDAKGAFAVARFVEKPDAAHAAALLAAGGHYWNSGMFVFRCDHLLNALAVHAPEILYAVDLAWRERRPSADFVRLGAAPFAGCRAESIDYAVMEKSSRVAMVEARFAWSDVGSWAALWQVSDKDAAGNVARGDVELEASRNCYVRADGRFVSVIGAEDLMVVATADAVLVAHKDRAQSVKDVVARLERASRTEHVNHRRVPRPWGYYETVDSGPRFQVKRLMVKPGAALSLQLHRHRAEHWVVVSGTARVTRGDDEMTLGENQSTYIPVNTRHRLENAGTEPLYLIEVQSGGYLGEDDIVRFEDRYARA